MQRLLVTFMYGLSFLTTYVSAMNTGTVNMREKINYYKIQHQADNISSAFTKLEDNAEYINSLACTQIKPFENELRIRVTTFFENFNDLQNNVKNIENALLSEDHTYTVEDLIAINTSIDALNQEAVGLIAYLSDIEQDDDFEEHVYVSAKAKQKKKERQHVRFSKKIKIWS